MTLIVDSLTHAEDDPSDVIQFTAKKGANFSTLAVPSARYSFGISSFIGNSVGHTSMGFILPTRDLNYFVYMSGGYRADAYNTLHEACYVSITSPFSTSEIKLHTRVNASSNNNLYPFWYVYFTLCYAGEM